MSRELLILRHGKSDWRADVDDFNRPLKKRGQRAAHHIGSWLVQQGTIPDLIISSPAARAIATAEICAARMGLDSHAIVQDRRIYEAPCSRLIEVLEECPDGAQRVLLVGHNPGLESLLDYLAIEPPVVPDDGKILPTATLARLAMPAQWRQLRAGCARLLALTRPGSLPPIEAMTNGPTTDPQSRAE
jgi:phosphohistidine phosphatase